VREALFGILGSAGAVEGARVLDLYAGTGALALEALSRGAVHATLVESSRAPLEAIRSNVVALGVEDRVRIVASDVRAALARLSLSREAGAFDLVLADPPWALIDSGEGIALLDDLAELADSRVLSATATVVLEHSSRTNARLDGRSRSLSRLQTRRYGDTALTFYKPAILAGPRAAPEGAGHTSE
jgi:16S rRNA (guanine966-N2)-methyltransferase